MPFSGGDWQSLYKETWICPITEASSLFDDCFLIDKKIITNFLPLRIQLLSIVTKRDSNYTTWGRETRKKWEKNNLVPEKNVEKNFKGQALIQPDHQDWDIL